MYDIFLSYARDDLKVAQRLAEALEEQGWSVFWNRTIPAGRSWREVIGSALADARCVVVLWSRHSIESNWVIEEAEIGLRRRVLVPVIVERIEPPLGFRSIQTADLAEWGGDRHAPAIQWIFGDVAGVLGSVPVARGEQRREAEAEAMRKSEEQQRQQAKTEEQRQRAALASAGNLDWKWIGIGVVVMLVLSLIAGFILGLFLASEQIQLTAGQIVLAAVLNFLAFAIGGFIVALMSAGRTVLEPGISAVIAVVIALLIAGNFAFGNIIAGGILPFIAGVLGGWVGERSRGVAPRFRISRWYGRPVSLAVSKAPGINPSPWPRQSGERMDDSDALIAALEGEYRSTARPLPPLEIGNLAHWLNGIAAGLLALWLGIAIYLMLMGDSLDPGVAERANREATDQVAPAGPEAGSELGVPNAEDRPTIPADRPEPVSSATGHPAAK